MISQRTLHYWLWFLLLSLVVGIAYLAGKTRLSGLSFSELMWLLVVGCLGISVGMRNLSGHIARVFDVLVGLLFTSAGLIGVLHNFGINLTPSAINANGGDSSVIFGLSLAIPFALLHTFIGLTTLNQGLKSTTVTPPRIVNPTPTDMR